MPGLVITYGASAVNTAVRIFEVAAKAVSVGASRTEFVGGDGKEVEMGRKGLMEQGEKAMEAMIGL